MLEVGRLLGEVQSSLAAATQEASLASGAATNAMSTLTHFLTPGAGGPLNEMAHHVKNNSQSVIGMQAEVDKLVADLLQLSWDTNTRLNSVDTVDRTGNDTVRVGGSREEKEDGPN